MDDLSRTKIGDEYVHVLVQKDILGLEISMDHFGATQVFQCDDHLGRVEPSAVDRQLFSALDMREQFPVLGVSEHKVQPLLVLECTVQLYEERRPRFAQHV